jgi:hypothetical protein
MNKSKQARNVSSDLHFYASLQFEQAVRVIHQLADTYPGVTVVPQDDDRCGFIIHSTRVKGKGTVRRWNGTHSEVACEISFQQEWRYFVSWIAFFFISGVLGLAVLLAIQRWVDTMGLLVFVLMLMYVMWFVVYMASIFSRSLKHAQQTEEERNALLQNIVRAFRAAGQVAYHSALLTDTPPDNLIMDDPMQVHMPPSPPKLKHGE